MELNSQNYFEYKKNKMRSDISDKPKKISKISFLFQLFGATFIIFFLLVVFSITKYSKKMDIEYTQNDYAMQEAETTASAYDIGFDEEKRPIDKRLRTLQQEENAPSEAKIIQKPNENEQVIGQEHAKEIKKNNKIEKIQQANAKSENRAKVEKVTVPVNAKTKETKTVNTKEIAANKPQQKQQTTKTAATAATREVAKSSNGLLGQMPTRQRINEDNITIMSKVLVGRYSTFDDAARAQAGIKEQNPSLTPYVRKIGDVYSVQMGSYQDFYVAKSQAQKLKSKGYDVWIYQQ